MSFAWGRWDAGKAATGASGTQPSERIEGRGGAVALPRIGPLVLTVAAVVALAIALRMPSCGESFWVDELHSAWTVWDDLAAVAPRAGQGHQSSLYFFGLWTWKQFAGDTEWILRLSSVLAVAAATGVLAVGVANWTGQLAAGLAAGGLLAVESNALFFGTELRPYAWVILFASVTVIYFLSLSGTRSRDQLPRSWVGMVTAMLMAMLMQPTSVGVLAWLCVPLIVGWWRSDRRRFFQFTALDLGVTGAAAAVAAWLWFSTLGESWSRRGDWASFATASSLGQILQMWDWPWLLVLPSALSLSAFWVARLSGCGPKRRRQLLDVALVLSGVTALSAGIFWCLSAAAGVPVWHRRFLVASLPLFCVLAGAGVALVGDSVSGVRGRRLITWGLAAGLIVGLAYRQETLDPLTDLRWPLVRRGEDWRSAVAWLQSHHPADRVVAVDSGLIEAQAIARAAGLPLAVHASPADQEYLTYPLRGPYRFTGRMVPVANLGEAIRSWPAAAVISRRPLSRVDRAGWPRGTEMRGFGNLTVILPGDTVGRRGAPR
jgi:hypothetical protein